MFSLKVFGSPSIHGPDGPIAGRAAQRQRVALLALLAVEGRAVSRDRLIALLWPENDTDRARRLLSDSVYLIRKALGEDAVLSVGDDLQLNPRIVQSDVGEFENSLERGDPGHAVAVYRGPLLDGFHLNDAPEWERWLDGERDRLARAYAKALENLAEQSAAEGDPVAAVDWWRRLAAHDPHNGRIALQLMRALDGAGDRAGALQHARVHTELLRDDFGAEPDPEIGALAERLRTEPVARLRPEPSLRSQPPAPPAPLPESPSPEPGTVVAPSRRRLRTRLALVALLFVVALSAVWSVWQRGPRAPKEASSTRIAVLPFAVRGGSEIAYLGEGLVDLLSADLDGVGEIRSVDPRSLLYFTNRLSGDALDPERGRAVAARFGAGMYVLGSVAEAGERIRIHASLYDAAKGQIEGQAAVEGKSDDLFALVDRLAAQLVGEQFSGPGARLNRVAAVTTGSLPALRAFLQGEQRFRQATMPDVGIQFFQQAVQHDSTFALAQYRLSIAAGINMQLPLARQAADAAFRHRDRLSSREAELFGAWQAFLNGQHEDAERRYRNIIGRYPEEVEGWYLLGELLLRANPLRGRSVVEAREPLQRALRLDPKMGCARCSLIAVSGLSGDRATGDSLVRGFDPPQPATMLGMRAAQASWAGNKAEQEWILRQLRTADDWTIHETQFGAAFSQDLPYSLRVGELLDAANRPPEWRGLTRILGAYLEVGRGRPAAARRLIEGAAPWEPGWTQEIRAHLASLPFLPAVPERLSAERAALLRWNPQAVPASSNYLTVSHNALHPEFRLYLAGLLAARTGDHSAAERAIEELERTGSPEDRLLTRVLAATVRARNQQAQGDVRGALATLERSQAEMPVLPSWYSPFYAQLDPRWTRAELLAALGRNEEALRWYGSFGQVVVWDLAYLAPAHLRQAEILERLGKHKDATKHYARFVDLWKDAEPELRPAVMRVQQKLQQLQRGVQATATIDER